MGLAKGRRRKSAAKFCPSLSTARAVFTSSQRWDKYMKAHPTLTELELGVELDEPRRITKFSPPDSCKLLIIMKFQFSLNFHKA
tara:strand:+ start:1623 stop:1874 length:252 start_codon:yes stop_codon:yes gene_type:complete